MLGFSDGTKDGGYFMANWSIYKAKEHLTGLSKKYGINIAFLMVGEVRQLEVVEIPMSFMPQWAIKSRLMIFS